MWDLAAILLTTLHLTAAYLATAGVFVAVGLEWRGSARGDWLASQTGRRLAYLSLAAVVVASLLGVGVWLMVATAYPGPVARALEHLPPQRLWLGLPERLVFDLLAIGVFLVLTLIYALTWNWGRRPDGSRRWVPAVGHRALGLVAATDLAYHLPVLFAVLVALSTRPEWWDPTPSFLTMLLAPQVWVRVLHGWVAAVAVCGGALLLMACRWPEESPEARRLGTWGANLVLYPTLLQLLVGGAMIFSLPQASRMALFGQQSWVPVVFIGGLLATFALLHAAIAAGSPHAKRAGRGWAVVWLVLVMVLMVATRHGARHAQVERLERQSPGFQATGAWDPPPPQPARRAAGVPAVLPNDP